MYEPGYRTAYAFDKRIFEDIAKMEVRAHPIVINNAPEPLWTKLEKDAHARLVGRLRKYEARGFTAVPDDNPARLLSLDYYNYLNGRRHLLDHFLTKRRREEKQRRLEEENRRREEENRRREEENRRREEENRRREEERRRREEERRIHDEKIFHCKIAGDDDTACAICYTNVAEPDSNVWLCKLKHAEHPCAACIEKLFRNDSYSKCPICRAIRRR
jgi:hypothetical protein